MSPCEGSPVDHSRSRERAKARDRLRPFKICPEAFMPQTATFDHYEVLTRDDGSLYELGRGAMGVTYKAFDTRLLYPVCLKVINAAYLNSEVARQRFIREARSAAKLRHRNVASVFHLGTEGDTWFYAMEFIDGETVDAVIKRQGTLAPKAALEITAQVARALNAAAQRGLVHRDIKPSNLMLVQEDNEVLAKVIDFGLAKTLAAEGEDAPTLSMGGFVGTAHFASPEQLEEREIDVRSDIYSLGITLWYMLAGKPPFGGSIAQVMNQHLSKLPPFGEFKTLPPAVTDLLRKMLEKNPADRFQTPAKLRKAIEDALAQMPDAPAEEAPTPGDGEALDRVLGTASQRPGETRFETGVTIAGRYRIAEAFGERNACRVFRAEDHGRQRDVRLLVLDKEILNDSAACTALEREVERLRQAPHPNLLGLFDFETIENASFIAMEWTNGFSLRDLLRARRQLGAEEAILLLKQAAAGIDHALRTDLTGIEFRLHQVMLHFAEPFQKETLLRQALSQWPAFTLKLDPLGATHDFASSQTWAGGRTMIGGSSPSNPLGADARGRYIRSLAAVGYELLGGTISPGMQDGAGLAASRYTPLATLSEDGNQVLQRALDPSPSFAGAQDFCNALAQFVGLPAARREPMPAVAKPMPSSPPATLPPALPTRPVLKRSGAPLGMASAVAALLVIIGGGTYYMIHKTPAHREPPAPPAGKEEQRREAENKANEEKRAMEESTLAEQQARKKKLASAVSEGEKMETEGNIRGALERYLEIAKNFPDTGPLPARNHIETLVDNLRQNEPPLTTDQFESMRDLIVKAAQQKVVSAMVLMAQRLKEKQPEESFQWYKKAADAGDSEACYRVGKVLSEGTPGVVLKDQKKAREYFERAADKGDMPSKAALGEYLLQGYGGERDETRGLKLLYEAIAARDAHAMNFLGDYLVKKAKKRPRREHRAASEEYGEAFRLFTESKNLGDVKALANLGLLYMQGVVPGAGGPDYETAVALFAEGAKKSDPFSMYSYARCLEAGVGIKKDQFEANSWDAKAAKMGDKDFIKWCNDHKINLPGEPMPVQ
jgi:serine/threonine protein kinase/TPR repeat protein